MSFSETGRSLVLSCFFLGEKPPKLYLAAYRKGSEVKGAGYDRVPLDNSLKVVDGTMSNSKDLSFPVAKDDWGEIVSLAIVDAMDKVIFKQEASDSTVITVGQRLRIPAGRLQIRLIDKT